MIIHILWGILALLIGSVLYLIYTLIQEAKFFKDQGVFHLGNGVVRLLHSMIKKITIHQSIVNNYEKVKSQKLRFAGSMDFGKPTYLIVDLDLAKRVFVKDFDHFVDRRSIGGHNNAMLSKMLLSLEGDKWKAVRSKLSPTFTTGKIRRMFTILNGSGKKMAKYLEDQLSKSPDGVLDLQEGYSKYTMDVIASVAFGIDSKAFIHKDPSHFERMGSKLQFKVTGFSLIKFMITILSPKLGDFLGISLFAPEALDFFSEVIKSTIKYREENKEKRDDFLQLMLQARAGQLKTDDAGELSQYEKDAAIVTKDEVSNKVTADLEDDDIVAHLVSFIVGGFDTTQSLLLFAAYNLAIYPEIQERLFKEIKISVEENVGELTYDSVNQMEYMEKFISETLRYYPPGVTAERMCTKSYRIPDSDVTVNKGSIVNVPIFGIHRDPEHYPEPHKFDPERFSVKNRSNMHPCAYMPFGYGPRNCIAMRLALMESKMAVAHLVLNFFLQPSEKTPIPMKFAGTGALKPDGGMSLKLTSRK